MERNRLHPDVDLGSDAVRMTRSSGTRTMLRLLVGALAAIGLLAGCSGEPEPLPTRSPLAASEIDVGALLGAPVASACESTVASVGAALRQGTLEAVLADADEIPGMAMTIDGSGIAAVLVCPHAATELVGFWTSSWDFVGVFDPQSAASGANVKVHALEGVGSGIRVRWTASEDKIAPARGTLSAQASVSWLGSSAVIDDVGYWDGTATIQTVVESVLAGREVSASLATRQAVIALTRIEELGIEMQLDELDCVDTYAPDEGRRTCSAPVGQGQSITFLVALPEWNEYRVLSAYAG